MPDYVGLLRGINVGGRHRVPMKPLRAQLEAAGLERVRTYLQSGNVVFTSRATQHDLVAIFQDTVEAGSGFRPAVVMRSAERFCEIADAHPFLGATDEWSKLQVGFLEHRPPAAAQQNLTLPAGAAEQFECRDTELYVYYPDGLARTRVSGQFWESRLQQTCTMRNWKTVQALKRLLEET